MNDGMRVGIDIGGTFTDLVFLAPGGGILRSKVLSTPDDYGRGIVNGLEGSGADGGVRGSRLTQIVRHATIVFQDPEARSEDVWNPCQVWGVRTDREVPDRQSAI